MHVCARVYRGAIVCNCMCDVHVGVCVRVCLRLLACMYMRV